MGNIHSRGTLRCTRIRGSQSAAVSSSRGRTPCRGLPVEVPEVGEGAGQVEHARAGDPDVRVAPLRGVRRPDVVAAHEADPVVDDEDLAVVAAVAAQVEEPPAGGVDGVLQHLEARAEPLEQRRHHEVREPVVDRVDLDTASGCPAQRPLERLAGGVALPDVGLEQDPLLGALDGGQHVVVQVLAEGVRGDGAVADRDLGRGCPGERLGLAAPAAVGVDEREHQRQQHLEPEQGQERALGEPRQRVPAGHRPARSATGAHAGNLSCRCRVVGCWA